MTVCTSSLPCGLKMDGFHYAAQGLGGWGGGTHIFEVVLDDGVHI